MKYIINIHSFIDVITNSSTELFVCNTDKTLETIETLVYEMEKQYPNEYGHKLSVDYCDDYQLQEVFGYIEEEDAVKFLKAKGYNVTPPKEKNKSSYISISAERGGLDPRMKKFIEETFNVIEYNSES